ncbi:PilT/PilU family type 4a pilus ATPase [Natronospira bacteriovora]|uniref:PilT/PilU family type 4a pilus ATPase n=1 Tax=Natronospira bacteriovora TaxID=3069753 RepID=A0ABU0WA40_9GAMM|nr:PilT/PilU family type 4a pilus ATPase [Natronospira sp. AB-CW4]MDQ2070618.1 PilT/PilU family type 4a pilus ATPase [Natronospira sp. AB-CW4]
MMNLAPYLKLMADKKASDLYLTANAPVKIRVEGRIASVGKTVLTPEMVEEAIMGVLSERDRRVLEVDMEVDFALSEKGVGRFRGNAFRQRGQLAMVLRYIPSSVPELETLGLPSVLKDVAMTARGLVLMCGATGSGKSTTLAAMINHRNQNANNHILTIEDPIEYTHRHGKSIINQRELNQDTLSYAKALRSALREAPDVIQIGEIRDRETMESCIQLSGTGHLAISTLHSNNAHQTLDRIVNLFPKELHSQVFMDLSLNLRAIISQRLILGVDGKRVAACEVMINTAYIAELILKGQIEQIAEAMEDSNEPGMQTFDEALSQLYQQGKIELEEALRNADSRANLEAKINFG